MSLYRSTATRVQQFVPLRNYDYLMCTHVLSSLSSLDSVISTRTQTVYYKPHQNNFYVAQSSLNGHKLLSAHTMPHIEAYSSVRYDNKIIQRVENKDKKAYEANINQWERNKDFYREEFNRIKLQAKVYNQLKHSNNPLTRNADKL
jgi:hypothetical protein